MSTQRVLVFVTAMLVPLVALTQTAPPAQPFQRLAGCVYKPQRWNDGDSFHVVLPDQKEVVVRLYFVDTPEEERVYAADSCLSCEDAWHREQERFSNHGDNR